jgi:hypothetical protein
MSERTLFHYQAVLRSIDPDRNRAREYRVEVAPTLFGYQLRTWRGRIGARLRSREAAFMDEQDVLHELADTLHRRIDHGYLFIDHA